MYSPLKMISYLQSFFGKRYLQSYTILYAFDSFGKFSHILLLRYKIKKLLERELL